VIAPALKDYEVIEVFKKFDRNGDGSISYEEFKFLISKGTGQISQKPSDEKAKVIEVF
jgi:calcium-dependent protein kinase